MQTMLMLPYILQRAIEHSFQEWPLFSLTELVLKESLILRLLNIGLCGNKSNKTFLLMCSHLKYIFISSKNTPGKLSLTHCLAVHHGHLQLALSTLHKKETLA